VAILGVLVFVVALLASIALHELGHLLTAKRFGMKASRYFIGMGPTLWSRWRGETEYGVKAFPVGGFVKIVGMTQLEELEDPRDEPRAFWRQPAPQRAVVLAAGSAMHFLIAFVVLFAAIVTFGEPAQDTTRVDAVSECLKDVGAKDPGTCAGRAPAPARIAGVRKGDRVVAFEGHEIKHWDEFTPLVRAHPAGPAQLVVYRDGARVTLTVPIVRADRTESDGSVSTIGQIGITPGETIHYNVITAVPHSAALIGRLTTGSLGAMVAIPSKIPDLFKSQPKGTQRQIDDGGIASVVDIGRFSGQAFAAHSFLAVLSMIAALNVFVGLFNLLPLLPLDGGHLAILGFEQLRSGLARRFGFRDPGRVDLNKLMPAMVAFIVVMGSLTVVLVWASITNPIANPFKG
jgi:membrane-associated protease RseP (regulator of RpoE activity)